VPPCDCDISNAWLITLVQSFVVVGHVNYTQWSSSELTVLAAAAGMESATIITTLALLCSTNQVTLFAHSKSSKWMLKKFLTTYVEICVFFGILCVEFVSTEHEVFKEVKIFYILFGIIRYCSLVFWYRRFGGTYLLLYLRYNIRWRQRQYTFPIQSVPSTHSAIS
jgi:hypothetical protein